MAEARLRRGGTGTIEVVFETHSTSEDNERGVATGWLPGRLSSSGRAQAAELGARHRNDRLAAVFASDLARAEETARIAFGGTDVPILLDWRLRECDYGALNGTSASDLHAHRHRHLERPYPGGGESWAEAVERTVRFVDDLSLRWRERRVLVIGHVATRWGLEARVHGRPLDALVREEFAWRPGWVYRLG